MRCMRKLIAGWLLLLGLLLAAAAPAAAKTFYGDLYLGFTLGELPGLPPGTDLSALAGMMNLPFRGKVYHQDGVTRLDVDLPAVADLASGAESREKLRFQTFSLLFDQSTTEFVLLNHSGRSAYRLTIPAELAHLMRPSDPLAALTSKEFIQAFNQEGIRYIRTKRLPSRKFQGLTARGLEMTFAVELPAEVLAEMKQAGVKFDSTFKLRLYWEEETALPLLYELHSSLFDFTFELKNLRRDRLPEVLFELPAFYRVQEYSLYEIERLVNALGRELTGAGIGFKLPPEAQAELGLPEEPAAEGAATSPAGEAAGESSGEAETEEPEQGEGEEDTGGEPIVPPADVW